MNGIDPGTIGQAIITWGGSGSAGRLVAAAVVIVWLFASGNIVHKHFAWLTTVSSVGAWVGLFALKQFFQLSGW